MSSRVSNRLAQYQKILRDGCVVPDPCAFCSDRGLDCIMDPKNRNCAACTRRGRRCEKRFHNEREWRSICDQRDKIEREIQEAEEASARLFAKLLRLRKQQKFLKERHSKMLEHDSAVMARLDAEDPLSAEDLQELDRLADAQDGAQLAAVSDIPSFSQVMNDPSFWANVDFSAGGIAEPAGGSPSNSR